MKIKIKQSCTIKSGGIPLIVGPKFLEVMHEYLIEGKIPHKYIKGKSIDTLTPPPLKGETNI